MVALAFAAVVVNVFWAVALYHASALVPPGGLWSYVPLFSLEDHHIARLHEVGLTDGVDLLYVNRKVLADKLGMDPRALGRLRSVAELSLLCAVSPRQAELITEAGITTIRELSVAPPEASLPRSTSWRCSAASTRCRRRPTPSGRGL